MTCKLLIIDKVEPYRSVYIDSLDHLESWSLYRTHLDRYEFCLVDDRGMVHIEDVNIRDKGKMLDSIKYTWESTIQAIIEKQAGIKNGLS